MRKHKPFQRILAMALSIVMLLGTIPVASANTTVGWEITAFERLAEKIESQTVPLGTAVDDLDLPDTLTATILTQADDENTAEIDVQANGSTQISVLIPVTWSAEPEFDSQTAGSYVFTPDISAEYTLADGVKIPSITVIAEPAAMSDPLVSAFGKVVTTTTTATVVEQGDGWKLYSDGHLIISTNTGMEDWATSVVDSLGDQVTEVTIDSGVTYIKDFAFSACSELERVTIPNTVTYIGDTAFTNCISLRSVEIPASVNTIKINAFYSCTALESVTFLGAVPPVTVGAAIFTNCKNLEGIYVPKGSMAIYKAVLNFQLYKDLITEVTENSDGIQLRTTPLDLDGTNVSYQDDNGNTVSANPQNDNIIDTGEGWTWYRNAASGYLAKTLVLNGLDLDTPDTAGIKLPNGSTIVLADGSENRVKTGNGTQVAFGIHCEGDLAVTGDTGSLEITTGNTTAYSNVGISSDYNITISGGTITISTGDAVNVSCGIKAMTTIILSGGTIYAKSGSVSDIDGTSFPIASFGVIIDAGMAAFQRVGDAYTKSAFVMRNHVSYQTYIFDGNQQATDLKVIQQVPAPVATVGNVIVPGTVGMPLAGSDTITITLANETFSNLSEGANVSSWFGNLPQGLNAVVETVSSATITIRIEGTPAEVSDRVMVIIIPADKLGDSTEELAVTFNSNAKFDIKEPAGPQQRTDQLNLIGTSIRYQDSNGNTAFANPQTSDIINTGEGWAWYLTINDDLGYQAKTLVLNGLDLDTAFNIGINLPSGSTIVLADGSENHVNTSNNTSQVRGIQGTGDLVVMGDSGSLQITTGNTTGNDNVAIFAAGNITINGGTITVSAGDAFNGSYGIVSNMALTILNGTITVSAGNASVASYGIFAKKEFTISNGTIYTKPGSVSSTSGLSFPIAANSGITDVGMDAFQKTEDGYTKPASVWDNGGDYYTYTFEGNQQATDLKIIQHVPVPAATVGNVIVPGTVGMPLSGSDIITITLVDEAFSNLLEGADVSDWFSNLPQGLNAVVQTFSSTTITIRIDGTPEETSDSAMNITIPASRLTSAEELVVTFNSNVKFDIKEPAGLQQRIDQLDLTGTSVTYQNSNGTTVSANPQTDDIKNTGEGWTWYWNADDSSGYQAKTLVLNGLDLNTDLNIGIYLPDGSTVVLADGSENRVNIGNSTSQVRGIQGTGDLVVTGDTGSLQITTGNTKGSDNFGILSNRNLTISGGTITVSAGNASAASYGIFANQSLTISNGTIYASSGNGSNMSVAILANRAITLSNGTIYARRGSVSIPSGLCFPIFAENGITDAGMVAFQRTEDGYTKPASVWNNNGKYYTYTFEGNQQATDLKVIPGKPQVNNTAGTATITYDGMTIDLTTVSGLFTVDSNAGSRTYTVEAGGTGAGTISGSLLTVTEAGTIRIGLTTAETDTHQAGTKAIATITVNKGAQNAPTGLGKTDVTIHGGSDGKITGLTPNKLYEYKKDAGSYTAVTANISGEITGLSAGTYVVRLPGNDLYHVGADSAEIIIGQAAQQSSAKDVAGVTFPSNTTITGTTITATVANSVTSQNINLTVSSGATWKLYSDAGCQNEITSKNLSLNVGTNTAYVKVTAADGTTQVYLLTITRARGNSGGSSGGSGSGTTTPSSKPVAPVTGTAENKATVDSSGNASTTVTDKNITDAIANARAEATKKDVSAGEITVSINVSTAGKDANTVKVNLPKTTQQQVISNKIAGVELTIEHPDIVIGMNNAAITEINRQANADVQLTVTKTDSAKLGTAAKNAIGSRPIYDFKANYRDGKGSVTDFGKGWVYVSIPYTPAKNEKAEYLYAVFVDSNGKVSRVPGSRYDANTKSLIFTTNHFSVYGIGYTHPTAEFTDISSHWAKDSIDYVVGRGLLNGTSKTAFSPDLAMTRGMLVMAFGRLTGIDTKLYTTNSFTDVKIDSTFRPYIEWANSKGIIKGTGNSKFEPDRAITREEIAVIFANFAKATGYKLPITREAATYADASSIRSTYKTAITAMQQAGIMTGDTGNKFNPKASATQAEVSSMLHRYIQLTIDPATAQGWVLNDAGQYLYYKDGKAVTGTQIIGDVKYFFETSGVLRTGWMKDGDNWRFYSGNTMLVGWCDLSINGNTETYYFDTNGNMVSGKWLQISGKWYYFDTDGSLAKNTKVDGYEIDQNGVRETK